MADNQPTRSERAKVKRRIDKLVLSQGNPFIEDLLSRTRSPRGANKEQFRSHLFEAVDAGRLRLRDVDDWLDDVEGWGNQEIDVSIVGGLGDRLDIPAIRRRVRTHYGDIWNAPASQLRWPKRLKLMRATGSPTDLKLEWYLSFDDEKRASELDHFETWRRDKYHFYAYRLLRRRAIARFELQCLDRAHDQEGTVWLAGVFLSRAIPPPTRKEARAQIDSTIDTLRVLHDVDASAMDLAAVIKNLDVLEVRTRGSHEPTVHTERVQLASKGSNVRFATAAQGFDWFEDTHVRRVHSAMKGDTLAAFTGEKAKYEWAKASKHDPDIDNALSRKASVEAEAGKPLLIRAQLTRADVWTVLATFARNR